MGLTTEQQDFVNHGLKGHARVLAGPGTGKSYTSVEFLKAVLDAEPATRCHMITFTRAATRELREKFEHVPGLADRPPSTAHSFALSLLARASNPGTLRMADDWEKRQIVQEMIKSRMRANGHTITIKEVEQLTDEMAAGWQALDQTKLQLSGSDPARASAFVGCWNEASETLGFVHIGQIPYLAVQLLQDENVDPEVDLLVIDEYQDLNNAEVKLLGLLSEKVKLVAIGDDDQSIYGWRQAAPDGLLRFCDDYSSASYVLSVCHRCAPEILEPANAVIAAAPSRPKKPALTCPPDKSGVLAQLNFATSSEEFAGVARIVRARLDAGVKPSDIAVLVRTSANSYRGGLQPHFEEHGIELLSVDWAKDVIKDPEVRRLLALGRLVAEPDDSLAWAALLLLTAGIGRGSISNLYSGACEAKISFRDHLMAAHAAGYPTLGRAAGAKVAAAVDAVQQVLADLTESHRGAELNDTGWGGWLLGFAAEDRLSDDARRLLEAVGTQLFEESDEPSLNAFITQFASLALDLAEEDDDAVRLMTMASSKGLTVNTTILLGVDNATMPSPKGDPDEERRILYVAMTRATDFSVLTFAQRRDGSTAYLGEAHPKRRRSPFLQSLAGLPDPQNGPVFVNSL